MFARSALPVLLCVLLCDALAGCGSDASGAPRATLFRFPAEDPDGSLFLAAPVFHVDHDGVPADGSLSQISCLNYAGQGFPGCYGDHDGSDFMLSGGFATMDAGSASVVAAADGVVVEVHDGEYDRCHASIAAIPNGGIDCAGNPIRANRVSIRHADGIVSEYLHMMRESVAVEVGQRVRCGERLGLVGSSGRSSAPHVHFEVHDADGALLDPFAGPVTGPESLWVEQDGPFGLPAQTCAG